MAFFHSNWDLFFSLMKRAQEATDRDSDEQCPTELNAEVRTAFAKQYIAWKARGWRKDDFVLFLSESGFDIPVRTLTRWVAAVKQHGNAVSQNHGGNRERVLSQEETQIFVGYVLDRISKKQEML